ncbi:MAG: nucleotidyltransferase family protein [Candidatus Marinimicrobia bacterium]|nr:nucleotidyltransferase family protein [Candidatus Neomarinimicrobiota bacterium]
MKIDAIVLAAGRSERAGLFKAAADLGGKPLLWRSIESFAGICERIIVVGGYRFGDIQELLENMPGLVIRENKNYEKGMFSSVQTGLHALQSDAFFLLPGDQPLIAARTYRRMAQQDADIVVPRYQGKKGHPVFFRASCIPEILAMPETAVLRDYIHAHGKVCILDVDDPGILMDADTPGDLERIRDYYFKQRKGQ